VVERMGWYCFDRGDARGALRWWQQLSEPHPAAGTIARFAAPSSPRPKAGRNDPCWCGSGRKFKHCHYTVVDVAELPPLPERVGWMCRKMSLWLEHAVGDARELVVDLAVAWATGDPDADRSEMLGDDEMPSAQMERAFEDPILFDAALIEGGLVQRFLHERGDLLPHDERLLMTAWLMVGRSVHEVVAVEPGVGMTLLDLGTGDELDVRERTASRHFMEGERLCARVVPDGATNQIVGGVFPVRTGHEEEVLDLCDRADPYELCAWAGAVVRPPRLVHTPGLLDTMFDRNAIETMLADLGGADEATVVAALNTEMSRQAQERWLDEHIPALGGLTPREAVADPTKREQVVRLLDEIDRRQVDGGFAYDTQAMRRALGLM
jgi:hypothetical protein